MNLGPRKGGRAFPEGAREKAAQVTKDGVTPESRAVTCPEGGRTAGPPVKQKQPPIKRRAKKVVLQKTYPRVIKLWGAVKLSPVKDGLGVGGVVGPPPPKGENAENENSPFQGDNDLGQRGTWRVQDILTPCDKKL